MSSQFPQADLKISYLKVIQKHDLIECYDYENNNFPTRLP